MKNNNYLVLLLAILCFTVLPSFTILDEDITIPETEINVELGSFITELRAELNKFIIETKLMVLKADFRKKFMTMHPDDMIYVYTNSNNCGGANPMLLTFGQINNVEGVDYICSFGGYASYEYFPASSCIPIDCGSATNN